VLATGVMENNQMIKAIVRFMIPALRCLRNIKKAPQPVRRIMKIPGGVKKDVNILFNI
jgi:hypothetical protein